MQAGWNDKEPIYRQLRERIIEMILDGVFKDGDAIPSVRQIASEHRINPLTVSKAIQMLVDEELVEKRRGLGMFVRDGASARLGEMEKEKFLSQEWPEIVVRIGRLGLDAQELLSTLKENK